MLAVVKRQVVFGLAPSWSSRLIAAEVVRGTIVATSTGGLWMIRNIFKHCYQKQCFWVNVAVSGLARNFNIDFPIDYSSAAINIIETKSV